VGTFDAWFAQKREGGPLCFVLGNRAWEVTAIHWKRSTCSVKSATEGVYPRWMGRPVLLSQALCQSILEVLVDGELDPWWSKRASDVIRRLREEHGFLHDVLAPLVAEGDKLRWWTFGGGRANTLLAALLRARLGEKVTANNLSVQFADAANSEVGIRQAIESLREPGAVSYEEGKHLLPESALSRLSKFQSCLPAEVELELAARRLLDVGGRWGC